jgi:hypothetical protein
MVRQYSIPKCTQFSQGNNVLDVRPSKIDCFLSRDTHVSSTQLNWPFETKCPIVLFLNPYILNVFLQKLSKFSQGKNVLDDPPSNLGGFLLRHTCVSSINLKRPILSKCIFLSLGNSDRHAILLSKTNSILTGKQ